MFIQLAIIAACVAAGWVAWLDYRIHAEFEGRRWTVPARVYGRPLEIFPGRVLPAAELERTLEANNYQLSPGLGGPGRYHRSGDAYEVYLRPFDYWDGHAEAGRYRITLAGGRVTGLESLGPKPDPVMLRMEPALIGKIYPDHNEDRVLVEADDVPPFLVKALIAVEDRHFYSHFGIDFKGILRALWANVRAGRLSQGGSTLTQQLVKNFFLTRERTFTRKFNEMIMAMLIERRYRKGEILLAYLNEVYLGQDGARAIHGFGTAAEFYFNKPLTELRDDQLALLAGMVRGASLYNPRRSPDRALERRNLVLRLMAGEGYAGAERVQQLAEMPVDVSASARGERSSYAAFLELAKRQLLDDYALEDLKNEGLRIHTTLDPLLQDGIVGAADAKAARLEERADLTPGTLETASVIVDIGTGEVLALDGGRAGGGAGFNRALDARRPIGSLVKPFIYLTALAEPARYNLLTPLDDMPFALRQDGQVWQPDNYDRTPHGTVSLMEAMINSYNLATVRLGLEVGLQNIISVLGQAGMETRIHPYPSLLLGAVDLSPYDVAQMYQTIANGGYRVPLNAIREVLDSKGDPLQRHRLEVVQALDEKAVFLTAFLMTRVVEHGTARRLDPDLRARVTLAGKTGTTNEARDSWFAGYDDKVLAVTWLGRDDNRPTPYSGASGAMQIWTEIMKAASPNSLTLVEPAGVAWTEPARVRFFDTCLEAGPIPYAGGSAPDNRLPCAGEAADDTGAGFDILKWFRR